MGIGLSKKNLYIIDVRFKQKNFSLSNYNIEHEAEVISLTPYSSYFLEAIEKEYTTFHDIMSEIDFKVMVLDEYKKMEKAFFDYLHYSFLFRDFAFVKTFEMYLKVLFDFLDKKKLENYQIIYLTDANIANNENVQNNSYSYIYGYNKIDKIIKINNQDFAFYKRNNCYSKISTVLYRKNFFFKIYNRFINRSKNKIELSYDNLYYKRIYENMESIEIRTQLSVNDIGIFNEIITKALIIENQMQFIYEQNQVILQKFTHNISISSNISTIRLHPFTFLAKIKNYIEILLYQKNNIPRIFMQHGSYLQENIFLKYCEIYPADINFVFNDFTKYLFEKRGAKQAYSVGSVDFNYSIFERKQEYDFLYIVYCTSYGNSAAYISSLNDSLSMDANNIFKKHQEIINLFGTKFKDKKICIKVQPGIFMGTMLYVPFLELSKEYKNITIEFSIPISSLIQKSKYIISDYFSSEFINRELHYKRDIILFKGAPLPLPEDTLEDMEKMFILVETVDDLKAKVENIEEITKDRPRYDDIIEYYSSKKCDTKKAVAEILEKELNART